MGICGYVGSLVYARVRDDPSVHRGDRFSASSQTSITESEQGTDSFLCRLRFSPSLFQAPSFGLSSPFSFHFRVGLRFIRHLSPCRVVSPRYGHTYIRPYINDAYYHTLLSAIAILTDVRLR